jgi:hypothetical protein
MSPILIALLVFVVLGLAATPGCGARRRLPSESQANARGAAQLGTLRWRDFTRLVLQAMHGRGYRTVVEDGMPADGIPTDGGDIVLERNGERTLLSVKYGSASVVGAQALLGLGGSATLRGAQQGHRGDARTLRRGSDSHGPAAGHRTDRRRRPVAGSAALRRPTSAGPGCQPRTGPEAATPTHPKAMGIAWGGAAAVVAAVAG